MRTKASVNPLTTGGLGLTFNSLFEMLRPNPPVAAEESLLFQFSI